MTASTGAQYTVEAGDSRGITLNDVLAFARQVEQLDPGAMDAKLWCASFGQDVKVVQRLRVRGAIPDGPRGDTSHPEPITALQKVKIRALAEQWIAGNTDAHTAVRAIAIDLGLDLHPETKGDPDDGDD
jgi:phage terminase small subunit